MLDLALEFSVSGLLSTFFWLSSQHFQTQNCFLPTPQNLCAPEAVIPLQSMPLIWSDRAINSEDDFEIALFIQLPLICRLKWQLTPVFLPGKSHGHRSLAGYSPWGCKAFDTTERLSVHAHTHTLFTVESRLPFSVKWQSRHSEKSCWKQNTQKWLIIDRKHLLKSIANKICNQLFKVKIIIMYCGVYK